MASTTVGIPGANPSGSQNVSGINPGTTAALGGNTNPLQGMTALPQGTSGVPTTSALAGLNPAGANLTTDPGGVAHAFQKAGYSGPIATLLEQFLAGGAGYNPQVAQAMIAALGPSIQQGQANLLEQFGSQGLRMSSPAAYGMASFDSQVTLDEGQILSQMYEQSVQNYMDVLLAGKRGGTQPTTAGSLISSNIGSLVGGAGNLVSSQQGGASLNDALGAVFG